MKADRINHKKLQEAFDQTGADALVVVSAENIQYFSGTAVYSALGWERIPFVLWSREGSPTLGVCNIDESWVKEKSWIQDIRSYVEFAQSPMELLAEVLKERGLARKTIGLEKMSLTAAQQEELLALVPTAGYVACDEAVANVRACKTEEEIATLRKAFHIAEQAIHDGFAEVKVGMTHKAVLDTVTGKAAALGASRSRSSFASGDTPPHSEVGGKKIKPGEVVRIDFVGRYEGYYHDIGRTAVVGDPNPEVRDFYRGRWRVQKRLVDFMRPGVRACDVYWRAFDYFEEEGLPLNEVGPHIGHGVGIGIHESPIIQPYDRSELEPNMTFCIEPRFPVPGVGVFHIEDLIRITETGSEILSDLYDTSEILTIEV